MKRKSLMKWSLPLLVVALAAVLLVPNSWNTATADPQEGKRGVATKPGNKDLDAIQKVIETNLDVTNNPETANLSLEERIELARRTHRPDSTYAQDDLPMYFASNAVPVVRGSEAYIRASELEFEAYRREGYKFDVQVEDMQIFQEGKLAVVVATTRGVITSPNKELLGASPARWTLALEKAKDGQWYIFHEHLSFFVDDGTDAGQRLNKLEKQVEQLGK